MTNKVITSPEELYDHVMDEYLKDDTELNSLFFNFEVQMSVGDILVTYAKLQKDINGDEVFRMENGKRAKELIPETDCESYEAVFSGNCMQFLCSYNGSEEFVRYYDRHKLWFII